LLFYRKLCNNDNIVLRTLSRLAKVRFEMLGIAAKYGIGHMRYSVVEVREAVWAKFSCIYFASVDCWFDCEL